VHHVGSFVWSTFSSLQEYRNNRTHESLLNRKKLFQVTII